MPKLRLVTTLLMASLLLLQAGCAVEKKQAEKSAPTAPAASSTNQPANQTKNGPKIGLFVDRAFGDRAFFDVALEGKKRLEKELGATVTTYEGQLKPENFTNQLRDAAQKQDLVFVLGFEGIDAMIKAAEQFPKAQFVFVDAPIDHPAITSVVYKDEEGCFLAGAMAAAMTTQTKLAGINEKKVIGFVGGVDAPVIRRCEAGYMQGASAIAADVKVESVMVGSFADPAKGRESNQLLVERGSDINYQYAGLSGEGGFQLAKSTPGLYAIGAGSDQTFLAPGRVLGNMLKKVDASMFRIAKEFVAGTLKRGEKYYGGLENGELAMQLNEQVPESVRSSVNGLQAQIISGKIKVADSTK